MKKVVLASLIILVFAATGFAQTKIAAYAGGGFAMPMSPDVFKDGWKMGFGGAGGIGYKLTPSIEIGARFCYTTFGLDTDALIAGVTVDGGGLDFMEFMADFKYIIPVGEEGSPFNPFLTAGVGFASVKVKESTISGAGPLDGTYPSESESGAALNGGVGLQYKFTPTVGFFVEGRFALIAVELGPGSGNTTDFPVRAGFLFEFGGTGE